MTQDFLGYWLGISRIGSHFPLRRELLIKNKSIKMCGSLLCCDISTPMFQVAHQQFYEVDPYTIAQNCSHSPTYLLGYFDVTQVMRWVRYFTIALLLSTHFLWFSVSTSRNCLKEIFIKAMVLVLCCLSSLNLHYFHK